MSGAILVSRDRSGDWSDWRPVVLVSEGRNTWRIWSWREPFTRLIHKRSLGLRVESR